MSQEFNIWLIYGLAAAGSLFLTIFLINIIAAPYRLASTRAKASEQRISELATKIEQLEKERVQPQMILLIEGISYGGKQNIAASKDAFVVFIRISNVGNQRSYCHSWKAFLTKRDGEREEILFAPFTKIMLQPENGPQSFLTEKDWIIRKSETPIEPGGVCVGALVTVFDRMPDLSDPTNYAGMTLEISCKDYLGRESTASQDLTGTHDPGFFSTSMNLTDS